jgi:phage gp46-like protein
MADIVDIALSKKNDALFYDIDFSSNGDFETVTGFETSLTMSLFTDKRVTASEQSDPVRRRGWIGDEITADEGFKNGSKLWLLDQARINFNTRNLAITYTNDALQWFIDDGYLKNVITSATISSSNVKINIYGVLLDNSTTSYSYELWQNTQGAF